MKNFALFLTFICSSGFILGQSTNPAPNVPQWPDQMLKRFSEDERAARLLESFNEMRATDEVQPERHYIQRDRIYPADTRNHPYSKLREQFVRSGKIPGIPGAHKMIQKKSGPETDYTHKLDSIREGTFDPYADAWVDYRVSGTVVNDTGAVVEGFTLDRIDAEGNIDTVYKYHNLFGEDGMLSERITYQRDPMELMLLPYDRTLYEFYTPDSIIDIIYYWDTAGGDWVLTEKRVYHYEGDINIASETYSWLPGPGTWKLTTRSEMERLDEGRHIINISWRWDESAGAMVYDSKIERAYDLFGNEILYALSNWNLDDNDFSTWMKFTDTFNAMNKLLESSLYYLLADSLGLLRMSLKEYEYVDDTLLNILTRYDFRLDSLKMFPTERIEYSYDEFYRVAYQTIYKWDSNVQEWQWNYKVENEYDAEGLLVTETTYSWNMMEQAWILSQKDENEYDPEGRLISKKDYSYNRFSSSWVKYQRTDYVYDRYGNLAQTVRWIPDEWTEEWVPDTREWTVYYEDGSIHRRSSSRWEMGAGAWIYSRENYDYSADGHLEKMGYNSFEPVLMEETKYRTEMFYNEDGMFTSWMEYDWDEITNDWIEDYRGDCIYGENGKIISAKSASLDMDLKKWIDQERVDAMYDEEARVTSLKYAEWDNFEQEWYFWDVDSFAYDTQGRVIMQLYLEWDPDTELLVNWSKWEYSYDEAGNPESEKYMTWDGEAADWINNEFFEYAFNDKGQLVASKEYYWNVGSSSWESAFFEEITYTASGNRSQFMRNEWDEINEVWTGYLQTLYTYDGPGNLINKETFTRNEANGEWENDSREIYLYDSQIEASEVWLPFDIGFNTEEIFQLQTDNNFYEYFYDQAEVEELFYWNFNVFEYMEIYHRVNAALSVILQVWSQEDSTWQDWTSLDFYFSSYNKSDVQEIAAGAGLRVYPNPVSDLLWIESGAGPLHKVILVDLTGRLVFEKAVHSSQVQLDVGHLKPGVYILKAMGVGGEYTSKIMVKGN